MRAIIQCYTPEEIERIARGEQTVKVCKTAPKDTPFKVYMYCTKDGYMYRCRFDENRLAIPELWNGKVVGEYMCERVDQIIEATAGLYFADKDFNILDGKNELKKTCLSVDKLANYLGEDKNGLCKDGKAIHISAVKFYDKPKELGEFYTICNKYGDDSCGDCPYLAVEQCSFPCDDCVDTWCSVDNIKPLTHPPRGWQYVEELSDD